MHFSAQALLLASALCSLVPHTQALPNPSKDLVRRVRPVDLDPAAAPHSEPHPNDPNSGGGHRGGSSETAGGSTLQGKYSSAASVQIKFLEG